MCWCQKLNRRTQSWYLMLPVLQEQAHALLGPGSQLGITRNDPLTAAERSLLHFKKHLDNTNTTVFEFGMVLCEARSWMIFAGLFQLRAFCDPAFVTSPVALKCRSSMSVWTRARGQAALWSLISLQFTLWLAQTVFLLEWRNQGKLLSEQKWRSEASRVEKLGGQQACEQKVEAKMIFSSDFHKKMNIKALTLGDNPPPIFGLSATFASARSSDAHSSSSPHSAAYGCRRMVFLSVFSGYQLVASVQEWKTSQWEDIPAELAALKLLQW